MASSFRFNLAIPSTVSRSSAKPRNQTTKIRCIGWVSITTHTNCSKDPEGILRPPSSGHIAKLEFKRRLEKDSEARDAFERQVREEKDRMRALRESRVIPDATEALVEYFLDTEAQEIEFEIARLRPRLNEEFFSHLKLELGKLRFAVSKTEDIENRVIELETLEKALQEGIGMLIEMLDMVEQNELNRSLLTLLDENIANAYQGNQTQAAEYMEKIRRAMLKYITV
ncbi:hypothetical protein PHJA_000322800 [Phtheirospermum japonicum]|uniref:Uncharacterized protein n=1 Tax=Phtheirospermum japonicum TaxID=374723 RepID=A0A830BCT3_9LAMI|nr:hypothetical protein PHJA_000322800 [Phtheirospermum japonicum]